MAPDGIGRTVSLKKLIACAVLLAGVVLAVPTTDLLASGKNLVSRWSGEGNANDSVDGNHGALGSGVSFVTGKAGQAFSFDGSASASISLPNSANLFPATGQLSIGAWIKPDFSAQNVIDTVLVKRDECGSESVSYLLAIIKFDPAFGGGHDGRPIGQVNLVITGPGGVGFQADSGSTVVPNDGEFHHVAGTYDGSLMKVYLDGRKVGQLARSGPLFVTATAPFIGHHGGTCPQRSSAIIDEIEFYDQALTDKRIEKLAGK